ncbi:SMC-Scp complex subunit ScpB [Spiroplasma endosymbiont of Amphibalanus improvisus]|uniref:SMC-Scp complex subunit ScpB n=1 Tax=Spiroplasma endosymbiont of Amphibalanus improvisus TaxID=3066327 RepID=UPI00313DFCEB
MFSDNELRAALEGLLYFVGDEGITKEKMMEVLEIDLEKLELFLKKLQDNYTEEHRGLLIKSFANKYRLTTKKEYYPFYLKLQKIKTETRLTQASMEVLAIIAYKGPISRVKIDELRGVNSDGALHNLRARNLVEEAGKSDEPGRPINFKVTENFLKVFNIKKISDLPKLDINEIMSGEDLFR